MTKMWISGAFALLLALTLAGCAHMPGGIAPSNTPIEGRKYTVLGHAVTTDNRILLLGLIPITSANSIQGAVDDAIRSRKGDALINVTVEGFSQWWILFTRDATRVEGDVIRFQAN